jgi:hypothetical protein
MPLSPTEREAVARMGGHARAAKYNSKTVTEPAREALRARWTREVLEAAEAHGETLSEQDLAKRVESMRKAHMTRMALRSAINRRQAAEARRAEK